MARLGCKATTIRRDFARVILCTVVALCSVCTSAKEKTIYVITDIHVMDSSLIVKEGSALTNYLANDRKMLSQSIEAFEAAIDSAIIHQADVLLICGDLTKDGEKIGHERVSRTLERVLQAGVKTFVIPGNHDIRNPYAKYLDGDVTRPAEWVTAEEFADIYRHFGYDDPSLRDPHSLSYVCEPIPGLSLLAIDASQYEKNTSTAHGDARNESVVGGAIKPATLAWLLTQADEARRKGNHVIAMMHQELIEHFDGLSEIDQTSVIENGEAIAQQLMEHGVRVVFTGHTHYTDAATAWNESRTAAITDITTGSTIAYPSHYRVASVSHDCSRLTVDTYCITRLPSIPDYTLFGRQFFENGTQSITRVLTRTYWHIIEPAMKKYFKEINLGITSITFRLPNTPDEFADLVYKHLATFLKSAWLTLQAGNEHDQDAYDRLYKAMRKGVYSMLGEVIEKDVYVLGKPIARREIRDNIMEIATPYLKSIFEDLNNVGTENECHTDDLHLNIDLSSGRLLTDVEVALDIPTPMAETSGFQVFSLQGRLVSSRPETVLPAGCYIVRSNNQTKKILVK